MIISEAVQGSEEWFLERADIPTASRFSRIVKGNGSASGSQERYRLQLLRRHKNKVAGLGLLDDSYQSDWMERGIQMEQEALESLTLVDWRDAKTGIMCYRDSRKLVAASPDGLIFDGIRPHIGIEIKCPSPKVHAKYVRENRLPPRYLQQVQGSLWVTGADYWIFKSYLGENAENLEIIVDRDEKYISMLEAVMDEFIEKMLEDRAKGWVTSRTEEFDEFFGTKEKKNG